MTIDNIMAVLAGVCITILIIWPHLWGLFIIFAGVLVALDRRPQ